MTKFSKPPLSPIEKEKKAEEFIGFIESEVKENKKDIKRKLEKEPTKALPLRLPQSLYYDIKEVYNITRIPINSICSEILRTGIKRKLKELKEEEM